MFASIADRNSLQKVNITTIFWFSGSLFYRIDVNDKVAVFVDRGVDDGVYF